ncbi:hypothetical protein DsansV1_C01g0003501 [Dioscorea sansibarensis]
MANWETAISVVLGVVMRKSICRFQEVGQIAMEFMSVFATAIRFSGLVFRRPVAVPAGRFSSMPSMVSRPDQRHNLLLMRTDTQEEKIFTALTLLCPSHPQKNLQTFDRMDIRLREGKVSISEPEKIRTGILFGEA